MAPQGIPSRKLMHTGCPLLIESIYKYTHSKFQDVFKNVSINGKLVVLFIRDKVTTLIEYASMFLMMELLREILSESRIDREPQEYRYL